MNIIITSVTDTELENTPNPGERHKNRIVYCAEVFEEKIEDGERVKEIIFKDRKDKKARGT